MIKTTLSLAIAATISAQAFAGHDDKTLVIEITSGLPQVENTVHSETATVQASPTTDGGELLQSLSGVSGIRMGGRAIDPVIRGQSQTQLNILLDGAYIHGGCPNRMDPPTSYTSVDSYDSVTVIKGNRTVVYGGGGPGGTVLFERQWPQFDEKNYTGELSAGYQGNGNRYELGADVAAGSDEGYIRIIGHKTEADNYDDGDGNEVRSSFESLSKSILVGYRLTDLTTIEASYEKQEEDDVLFAGAGMDSPYADADTTRLKLTHEFERGALQQVQLQLYKSDVKHNMDNYSLRPAGMMKMQAPSTSDTEGGRLIFDAHAADIAWTFGVDVQNNDRDAELQDSTGVASRLLWPGVEIDQTGLFVEGEKVLNSDDVVRAGARYDHVTAEATRANEIVGGMTPAAIWSMTGAPTDAGEQRSEDNVGGFVGWTHRLNDQYSVETTLSRSVRTADATERYMARMTMTSDWIGNPLLEPEKHHQLEVSLQGDLDSLNWSATGWYNRVSDYILRQTVAAGSKSRDIYRNVDAELYGAEVDVSYPLNANWQLSSALAWTVGNNLDDDTSLSRIAPLELNTSLDYQQDRLQMGVEWQLVASQNDICLSGSSNCGGQDVRQSPGYGVVNVHAQYEFNNGLSLLAGVDNLMDKAYTVHESRDDSVNPDPFQVAEPGRSAWIRVSQSF
ncbi:TonB-dependent copper receptor [Amphritea sp. 2_MG-2023]|uniref:TonB-dependent copper receptor n=1 Tax=Amphritea TaxID=515417 RepID=UPI001C065BFD|nr:MULTISPECIES: TonB-dependent copper receptor [Amphritea]MBU2967347.1 TonB-dependent copper receptor [Amphritea atlantica]MDO6418398.1 TonB-dependent copper receptor [Amphritea sp. 2_MG-2023]